LTGVIAAAPCRAEDAAWSRDIIMFADRRAAGAALAEALAASLADGTGVEGVASGVVLALPRGGVPVAAEIARALNLPLDLMLVRKVGLPGQPELALAAVAGPEGAELVVNDAVAAASGIGRAEIERLAAPERAELARRRALWLGDRAPHDLAGRTAILVDDGVATGATMRAAIRALRRLGPARIVVAVPVAAPETLDGLRAEADAVVCLTAPERFRAVGVHYGRFPQVADDEVRRLLDAAAGPG
jgi:putative phosphoribosyl transferase